MNNSRRTRCRAGFTLIEMLEAVFILSTLMSVSLPLYLQTQQNAERRSCRVNQQTIANAIQAARQNFRYGDYGAFIGQPVDNVHIPDLQVTPVCVMGGTYTITQGDTTDNMTFKVNCNVVVHGSYQPGVDID